MPQYIRHLPGNASKLFDKNMCKEFTNDTVFFNPSVSQNIIYIRGTIHNKFNDQSFIILYDIEKSHLHKIDTLINDYDLLQKNINLWQGLEDLRIMHWGDKLWFTATSTHSSKKMENELIIGYFDKDKKKVEKMKNVDIKILPVKNICPFVYNNKLYLFDIYLKKIYEFIDDKDSDEYIAKPFIELKGGKGINIDGYRGSTSPVHLSGNIWGCIIHDVIFNDNIIKNRLSYLHFWMEFDITSGVVTFLSSSFWILNWGIEYVSGIKYNKKDNRIDLFMGVNDNDCFVYQTDLWKLRTGKD